MKISLRWLNDYIDIKKYFAVPEELQAMLTAAGLEVEAVENRARDFQNVVIGHILKKDAHPNADKLSLCQVQTGQGVVHSIVCGAKNHKEGDRVVVALPGAVLPGGFAIKLSKIRGVESAGMLCSEKELGLAETSDGILILPPTATIGEAYAAYSGLDDIVFDLKVTPNRADCLSHFGLCRELATLTNHPANWPRTEMKISSQNTKDLVSLKVEDPVRCPRYTGRVVRGVKVGPSPDWMKRRLESIGLKSINNVVDITNYVMMELGQPLHAFDLREIRGGTIVVGPSRLGEIFRTFDGTDLKLDGTELVIRDKERPIALAGVIGGVYSGVQPDTTDLFIESAYFNPAAVRRASRKFGIETDSSYRFSRGADPEACMLALDRACEWIQKLAGGEVWDHPHDAYPHPVQRAQIEISASMVADRLGFAVTDEKLASVLRSLGCHLETYSASGSVPGPVSGWKVSPPLYRGDLQIAEDLMEEYARVTGYDQIPDTLPLTTAAPSSDVGIFVSTNRVGELLRQEGFLEARNFCFIGSQFQSQVLGATDVLSEWGVSAASEPVRIQNPLNEELDVMRVSLVPGLLKNISHNCRHGSLQGRLFETGSVFEKSGEQFREPLRLGVALRSQTQMIEPSKPTPEQRTTRP